MALFHRSTQVSVAFERAGVKPMWVNALHTHIANHPTCSSWTDVPHVSFCKPRQFVTVS
jgi:hypothetical protein